MEVKQDYINGFEETCKKAGLDPKEVFTKSSGFFDMVGRTVSEPLAGIAKHLGTGQYGAELGTLNKSRALAGEQVNLRRWLAENGLGGGRMHDPADAAFWKDPARTSAKTGKTAVPTDVFGGGEGNIRGGKLKFIRNRDGTYTISNYINKPNTRTKAELSASYAKGPPADLDPALHAKWKDDLLKRLNSINVHGPDQSFVRSNIFNEGQLPAEIRKHLASTGKTSGLLDINALNSTGGQIESAQSLLEALKADPRYATIGKYTTGIGGGLTAGGLVTAGLASGDKVRDAAALQNMQSGYLG